MTNRKGKAARKGVSRPGMTRGSAAAKRARRAVESVERDTARRKGQAAKDLGRIQAEYRRELVRMLGAEGVRKLDVSGSESPARCDHGSLLRCTDHPVMIK